MSKFVDLSDVKDQARGAVDFWGGLLDASGSDGAVKYTSFRQECAALIDGSEYAKLAHKLIETSFVLWKYSSGKEIESCYLLLCALARRSSDEEQGKLSLSLAASIASQQQAEQQLKIRLMAVLYNFFPTHRFALLLDFVEQSRVMRDASIVESQWDQFQRWSEQWKLTAEQRRKLYVATFELFQSLSKHELAYQVVQVALLTLNDVNEIVKTPQLIQLVKTAVILGLSLPAEYIYEDFLAIPAVEALHASQQPEYALLHTLLKLLVEGSVSDYEKFASANEPLFASNPLLRKEDLLAKVRLLSLASECEDKTSISFDDAARALGVSANGVEVESWIIRAISKGLISGKLDQLSRKVSISFAISRKFGAKQWSRTTAEIDVWLKTVDATIDVLQKNEAKK